MKVSMVGISPPGLRYAKAHMHEDWEILLCLNGECTLTVGERTMTLVPGTIVCQPPHIAHSTSSEEGYQDLWVRVSNFAPPAGSGIAVFQDDAAQRFRTLLLMMHSSFAGQEPQREQFVAALWEALYQLLCSWNVRSARSSAVTDVVQEMILHIADAGWKLADCMAQTGYSADHLRRCFKKETGLSPAAYLTMLRIEHARKLLALSDHGGYTIKQIALMSGFEDPYYFSRTFKKRIGCSPNGYSGD